ncbi:hypothetical protein F4604DRAFT_1676520 [Suillus subluteus]|nr:hypothetical protein F4604DRAFT_1676520 [Suillus subluteus]
MEQTAILFWYDNDPGPHTVDTTEGPAKLRELLKSQRATVEAFFAPSEDQRRLTHVQQKVLLNLHCSKYLSEYPAYLDEHRAFISGPFNGSAGSPLRPLELTITRHYTWLEEQLNGGVEFNESQAAAKLEEFIVDGRRELSFTTISSTGPNAGAKTRRASSHCALGWQSNGHQKELAGVFTLYWNNLVATAKELRHFTRTTRGRRLHSLIQPKHRFKSAGLTTPATVTARQRDASGAVESVAEVQDERSDTPVY